MQKAKKYDWRDSNLALFGSDLEKNIKKESAEGEPAWQGTGQKPELRVWRINKFVVEAVPEAEYGQFYNGDSYIVLNVKKDENSDALLMDVHFWIGQYSTADEYGTAAYKTVELDNFHDDVPIQHREVQDYESEMFVGYFKEFVILFGGHDSGFNLTQPDSYAPRLFHIERGHGKVITKREVKVSINSLSEDDCFVLDKGLKIYVIQGNACDKNERFSAQEFAQSLKGDRNGRPVVEVCDCDDAKEFLPDVPSHLKIHQYDKSIPQLMKISDSTGEMVTEMVDDGDLARGHLDTNDVFIVDICTNIFLWTGKSASIDEKRRALQIACNYADGTDHPCASISVVPEGSERENFWACFNE